MDAKALTKGTKIYYHGDMANEDGFGVIAEQGTDQYGTWVDVKLDDGRTFNKLTLANFSEKYEGHAGTKFVTAQAYRDYVADKNGKLNAMLEDAAKQAEKRGEPDPVAEPKPKSVGKEELRCQGCFCWNDEDDWERKIYRGDRYLICSNCGTWNHGVIPARPVKRERYAAIDEFVKAKGRS